MTKDKIWLLQEKYGGEKTDGFFTDCERLVSGEPLAYVIGHVPFLDCQIWLDSKPLIPRPETEYWTERAIDEIRKLSPRRDLELVRGLASDLYPLHILDLCAGSGAIGVAVAKALPEATVAFAEIDPIHLPIIKKNLESNLSIQTSTSIDWSKYSITQSNLYESIEGQFDFILTNPPYIDAKANTVDDSVVSNEPHLALFGGAAGMEIIERIIAGARAKLAHPTSTNSGGQLWIEHEPFQTEAISALAVQYHFNITTHDDQYQTPRYSVLIMAK